VQAFLISYILVVCSVKIHVSCVCTRRCWMHRRSRCTRH